MNQIKIIAEAGVNHNGDIQTALRLIDIAADAGADAIKFQTFRADKLVSKYADKAEYQKLKTGNDESQYEMLKKLQLSYNDHLKLFSHSQQKGIEFISSPFDIESIDLLVSLGLQTLKIPSGEITNAPYLKKIGELRKRIILSTGMANIPEIKEALNLLISSGTNIDDIVVMHATTEYPAPFEEVNLRAMQTIKESLNVKVGYSDHTVGIEVAIAAAALGAEIIEKHFTIDQNLPGPDHLASLDPEDLRKMISSIRNIERSLGNGLKVPSPSELKNIIPVRKSIHYVMDLETGHTLTAEDLEIKRPGNGISPMEIGRIIAKKLNYPVKGDTQAKWEDFL